MKNKGTLSKNKSIAINYLPDGGFLQSDHWATFQRSVGRRVEKLEDDDLRMLMIMHELPIVGGYFFVPRGPLFRITNKSENTNSNIKAEIQKMIEQAKNFNANWVRVEPQSEDDLAVIKQALEGKYKIVKSKKNHEPAQTLMVDLEKSEQEILAQMKSKTRYNIRLAAKKGVKVISSRTEQDVEKFIELTKITAIRDGITSHPEEYFRKMAKSIPEDNLKIYHAVYQKKPIAAIMVIYFDEVATYLHGASSNEHRNVMAPFALQWQAMQDAKKAGYHRYDLGGTRLKKESEIRNQESGKWVPEEGNWRGITKFKQGFCPNCQPVEFPGCWDIVLDRKKYNLYGQLQWAKDLLRKIGI